MTGSDRRRLGLVLLLGVALALPFLGQRDLWAPDEPRYAEVARETLVDGHWWQPHVNGRPYDDKPPLYFWLVALVSLPAGDVSEWTARLPSALSWLALLALTFDLGRRLLGRDAGAWGTAVLATAWLSAWMARRVNLDVPLAAASTLAVWSAWRAVESLRAGGRPLRAAPWGLLAGVACGAGAMIKGPVVLLPVCAAVGALAAHPAHRRGTARSGLLVAAAAGLAGLAGVAAAWLIPAATLGGYDVAGILREHVVERAAAGRDHVRPAWYYLQAIPLDFLPWSLFAVQSLVVAWRTQRRRPEGSLLLAWALVPLVALSLIVEKRNIYVVPMLPPLALLVGGWLAGLSPADVTRRAVRGPAWLAAVLLGTVALGAAVLALSLPRHPNLAAYAGLPGLPAALVGLALTATGATALVAATLARRRAPTRLFAVLVGAFAAVELALFALAPVLDPVKSARPLAVAVQARVRHAPVAVFPDGHASRWAAYVYYGGRTFAEARGPGDLAAWLATVPRPAYVLTDERSRSSLPPDGESPPQAVLGRAVGHRDMLLVRYASPDAPAWRATRPPVPTDRPGDASP